MKYNLDTVVNRRNTDSLKWDVAENELPMWVADMDFRTAPEITEAIAKRVEHGIFGYSIVPDEWADAYIHWWDKRHGLKISRDELIFCTGVVPAISSAVRKLTTPAEKVVVLTPCYNIFFNSIYNNGRNINASSLKYDGLNYSIDWDDLEARLADPQTTLMILCNPQNPVGKIWDKEILARIGELCYKNHVYVVSDEIHCDLTDPDKEYVPFASVSDICREISVSCVAPTKTFGIPGLQTAAVIVPNPTLRHKVNRGLNTDEVAEPNSFAQIAAIAAFEKGGEWLDEVRAYIYENKKRAAEFFATELPEIVLTPSEATYLLWLNCSSFTNDSGEFADFLRRETGLFVSKGEVYGEGGKTFLRMNIACPRETLEDGLARLKDGVKKYIESK